MLKTYLKTMIAERLQVLRQQKQRLEEQITQATGNEIELPSQFEDQRRSKLAEIIKELKTLEPYEERSTSD